MFQKNDYVLFNTYGFGNVRGVIVDPTIQRIKNK